MSFLGIQAWINATPYLFVANFFPQPEVTLKLKTNTVNSFNVNSNLKLPFQVGIHS